jgi:hypothetical protein
MHCKTAVHIADNRFLAPNRQRSSTIMRYALRFYECDPDVVRTLLPELPP